MEGEDLLPLGDLDIQADRIVQLLGDRRGGFDWQSLSMFVALFGITDIDGLLIRLFTILTYRPPGEHHGHRQTLD